TAGMSSATKIHAVGEMIRAAGTALISAVLLGADRSDESLGFATSLTDDLNAQLVTDRAHPDRAHPDRVPIVGQVGGAGDEKAAPEKVGDLEPINGRDVNSGGMIGSEPSRTWRR